MSGTRLAAVLILLFSIHEATAQQKWVVSNTIVTGNHRTKTSIILRELPFKAGDTIDQSDLASIAEKAKQTLTNTSLFNFIDIEHLEVSEQHIIWQIKVQERWYVWPGLVLSLAETNFNSWWQNKDFNRINYGFYVQDLNSRGRREVLTIQLQSGWQRLIGLNYMVPGFNKSQTLGAGIDLFYANNREVNFGSLNNERLFFRDAKFIQEEFRIGSHLNFRPQLWNNHRIRLGMNTVITSDTLLTYTTSYLPPNKLRSQYLYASYSFRREKRDNVGYPLKGYLIDATIDQEGFGIINQDDVLLTEAFLTFNVHSQISGRWYYAQGIKSKLTVFNSDDVPYYFQRGLGYSNAFIRGYELYVIDGQHYLLYKTNLKYNLIKKRTVNLATLAPLSFDKFHYSVFLNAFADAGYAIDNINSISNPLANNWQYSAGLGLDFVTYYDIVVRFEGCINKQGVPGFYIHFKNPI